MVSDAKAHKLDLIITKSVSAFARNVEDFLGTIRSLTEPKPPVGVFFEAKRYFLSMMIRRWRFLFSRLWQRKSPIPEAAAWSPSLRMRLDNGLPLTAGFSDIIRMQTATWSSIPMRKTP